MFRHAAAPLMVVAMMLAGGDGVYNSYYALEQPVDNGDVTVTSPYVDPTPAQVDCNHPEWYDYSTWKANCAGRIDIAIHRGR